MIAGIFHKGSGLGNQLHRYVATRALALNKGVDFGMMYPENFKGHSFMQLVMGIPATTTGEGGLTKSFDEKKVVESGVDIRSYDPEINFVEDGTLIDGEFQDERYFENHLDKVNQWLKVEPINMPSDVCVINFRGGEYVGVRELFLTADYWSAAIWKMREINPQMKFEVHTDDVDTAQRFFPDFPIIHDIGINWRSIRYAKFLILSNSSFAILPSLLNENALSIIAPRYWARRNTGVWALPQNFYKKFTYI